MVERSGWWCFEILSRALEPAERAAVQGDLIEARVSGTRACPELVGLVIRRQAALWTAARPWVALLGIVYLLMPLLVQCMVADGHMLIAYTTQEELPMHLGQSLVCGALLTLVWSWSSGFALAAISGRSLWITGPLLYAAAILGVPYGLDRSGAYRQLTGNPDHAAIILTIQVALFLLPSVWGLRCGMRGVSSGTVRRLTMLSAMAIPFAILVLSRDWTADAWLDRLSLYAVLSWPMAYQCTRMAPRNRRRGAIT